MTEGKPKRLLIDTDPGVDDSMAILLAFASPEVEIEGFSTVFGNVGVDLTTQNAYDWSSSRAPRHSRRSRSEKPLLRPFTGKGGKSTAATGWARPSSRSRRGTPDPRRAAQFIIDTIMANPGEITLVPLGPLTNIALAVATEPRIAENVREVVLMGGSGQCCRQRLPGCRGQHPQRSGVGLHRLSRRLAPDDGRARCDGKDGDDAGVLGGAGSRQQPLDRFHRQDHPALPGVLTALGVNGFPVHDSSALAYVIDPTLFETRQAYVDVDYHSPYHAGIRSRLARPAGDGAKRQCLRRRR